MRGPAVKTMDVQPMKDEFHELIEFMREKNEDGALPFPLSRISELWEEMRYRGVEFR